MRAFTCWPSCRLTMQLFPARIRACLKVIWSTVTCTSVRLKTLQLQSEAHSVMRPASKYVHHDTAHSDCICMSYVNVLREMFIPRACGCLRLDYAKLNAASTPDEGTSKWSSMQCVCTSLQQCGNWIEVVIHGLTCSLSWKRLSNCDSEALLLHDSSSQKPSIVSHIKMLS